MPWLAVPQQEHQILAAETVLRLAPTPTAVILDLDLALVQAPVLILARVILAPARVQTLLVEVAPTTEVVPVITVALVTELMKTDKRLSVSGYRLKTRN